MKKTENHCGCTHTHTHTHTYTLNQFKKSKKGITLIALVITIVVLVIIAGVAIAAINGNHGILKKSKFARDTYENKANEELTKLAIGENFIDEVASSRNNESSVKNDVDFNVKEEFYGKTDLEIEVKTTYENALYVYIINDKINSYSTSNTCTIKEFEEKNYNLIIIVIEQNGTIHRGQKQGTINYQTLDIFNEIKNSGKTFADYGITYTASGYDQQKYRSVYQLGMGSGSGINTDTFTVTIDYNKLLSMIPSNNYKGLSTQIYERAYTYNTATRSWVYSDLIINYDDGTNSKKTTETINASNTTTQAQPYLVNSIDKNVKNIQIILHGYDADYGSIDMWIKNLGLYY